MLLHCIPAPFAEYLFIQIKYPARQGLQKIAQVFLPFLLGVMLALLTIRTGSILPAMLAHIVNNILSIAHHYYINKQADKLIAAEQAVAAQAKPVTSKTKRR